MGNHIPIGKLVIFLAIIGVLYTSCFASNAVESFTPKWIDSYRSEAAFPDIDVGNYNVREGVLFQENILVAYPREKTEKEYVVPDGIEMIASVAFEGNQYLEKVILPSSITSIGDGAFAGCTELREINFPDRLLVIGVEAFAQCYSLENIELPSQLYVIGAQAFCDASMLAGTLIIPSSVRYIGAELLSYTNISTVIFEGCVEYVGPFLIGEPIPEISYEIQVPDMCYSFVEALQKEYSGFDNVRIVDTINIESSFE